MCLDLKAVGSSSGCATIDFTILIIIIISAFNSPLLVIGLPRRFPKDTIPVSNMYQVCGLTCFKTVKEDIVKVKTNKL